LLPIDGSVYWYGPTAPRVAPLRRDLHSDVVVVGGGIAGLTCAQALVERGVEVALLEQAFCGAGASGKSSGFITPDSELELSDLVSRYGERRGRELWEFAKLGVARILRTIEELGVACDYQPQDSLFVARSARAFRRVIEAEHQTHVSLGYRARIYDRSSLETIVGSSAYHGGIRYGGTFGINSYAYCRALRDGLESRGVRIYEGTPVVRFTRDGVETAEARVSARSVAVLADRYLPELGLATYEVSQVQTFLAVSQPLRVEQIETIFPADRFMVWDTDLAYQYFRITGDGRLLLGSSHLCDMYRSRPFSTQQVARKLYRYLAAYFPSLKTELEYLWPGLIGVSKDFLPVVGRHDGLPTVHFAAAAAGLPWAAALGDYLAQKITGGRDELDELLSSRRSFTIERPLQRLVGKPLAFALSHGAAKYLRK
jgi:gamma-glutamylputrescine oxidase